MQIFELTYAKKSNTLVENSLTKDQQRIAESIVREIRPLFETTLTANQIQQIFKLAQEKQAAKGSGVRTIVGKAVDATKSAIPIAPETKKVQPNNIAPPGFNQTREGYTRLTNSEIREIFAIASGELTEGPTWDRIKNIGQKVAAKAAPIAQAAAQRVTNQPVNANTLLKHWVNSGRPDDSGIVADVLRRGNVTDDVIKDIYNAMGIEVDTPASTVGRPRAIPPQRPAAPEPAAAPTAAPVAYPKTPAEIVADLQKTLDPAVFNEVATLMLKSKMSGMNKPK